MLPADIAIVRVPPEPTRSLAIVSSPARADPIAMLLAPGLLAAGLAASVGLPAAGALVAAAEFCPAGGAGLGAGACGAHATARMLRTNTARVSKRDRASTFDVPPYRNPDDR